MWWFDSVPLLVFTLLLELPPMLTKLLDGGLCPLVRDTTEDVTALTWETD